MIPIADITSWGREHPWADNAQVEQDLVISRTMVEIFSHPELSKQLLFRGGTALHKLFLHPPLRYSEDIDLVQLQAGPIGPIFDALRAVTEPFLGTPRRKQGPNVVTLLFRFESETPPSHTLRLKVEINTREHFFVYPPVLKPFQVKSRWFAGSCELPTYSLEELLGTKMRALYQRRKGRDLFDLWRGLVQGRAVAANVVECFQQYMKSEDHFISQKEFRENLLNKINDTRFLSDTIPLLRPAIEYRPQSAYEIILDQLISKLL